MDSRSNKYVVLFTVIFSFHQAHANPAAAKGELINLASIENRAIDYSIQIRNAYIQRKIAGEREEARFREYFPSLSVSYRQNRTVAQRDFDNGLYSVQITASQPVYDGGRIELQNEIAQIDQRLSSDQLYLIKEQVKFRAREVYLGIQLSVSQLMIVKASVQRSENLLNRALQEYQRGMITQLDMLEIKNQHDRNLIELDRQKRLLSQSVQDLVLLTGYDPTTFAGIQLISLDQVEYRNPNDDYQRIAEASMENHPEIIQSRLNLFRSRKEYLITRQYYLPTISLTARYGRTGETWPPTNEEWGFGVNFTFRGFDSTVSNDTGINRSRAGFREGLTSGGQLDVLNDMEREVAHLSNAQQLIQAQRQLDDLKLQLPLRAINLFAEFEERKRTIEVEKQSLDVAKKRFYIDLLSYQRGEISLEEYNEEELRLMQRMRALAEQQAGLLLFIGRLELEMGLQLDSLNLIKWSYMSDQTSKSIFKENYIM